MQRYQLDIRREALRRGIGQLFHFTPSENVQSILSFGLASREVLLEHDIDFVATDRMRLDGYPNALSVSIQSINESMFAAKRREYRADWVIIAIDASVLWTHPCRYCWCNASTSDIQKHRGRLDGPWAFHRMFEDRVNSINGLSVRAERSIEDCMPTNNDAEVQVLSPIDPSLILGIIVRNEGEKAQLEAFAREKDLVPCAGSSVTHPNS